MNHSFLTDVEARLSERHLRRQSWPGSCGAPVNSETSPMNGGGRGGAGARTRLPATGGAMQSASAPSPDRHGPEVKGMPLQMARQSLASPPPISPGASEVGVDQAFADTPSRFQHSFPATLEQPTPPSLHLYIRILHVPTSLLGIPIR